jgi:pyridoxamine 5'-phosphate oxidase
VNDPFVTFSDWYAEARRDPPSNPDIVALASATIQGRPSVRMVFYRGIREGGFSFFTNYESRKGLEFQTNPQGAMVFYWPHLGRQVRIEGSVTRLSHVESDAYFEARPIESQVRAVVSRQSRPLTAPEEFWRELADVGRSSEGKQIVRPETWGGFKLDPAVFEFWTRGEYRRHHRMLFTKDGDAWKSSRLYP